MDSYNRFIEKPTWTEALLSKFSPREIGKLAGYNERTTKITAAMAEFLKSYPITQANSTFAIMFQRRIENGDMLKVGQFGTYAIQHGQTIESDAKMICVNQPDGGKIEIANAPVPLPPSVGKRPYLQSLVAITVPMAEVKQGVVTQLVTDHEWNAKFKGRGSPIDPVGVANVYAAIVEISHKNARWVDINNQKKTLSGGAFLDFWLHAVTECSLLDYLAIHMAVIMHFVRAFDYKCDDNGKYTRGRAIKHNGEIIVDPSVAFVGVPKDASEALRAAAATFKKIRGVDPMFFKGPLTSGHPLMLSDGTFKTALGIMRNCNSFRGGGSGLGGLVANMGYTGYMSDEERSLSLIISSALGVIRDNAVVDVFCESVGRVPIVVTSLKRWAPKKQWKVVVSIDNMVKVNKDYKDYVSTTKRPEAHFVWISTGQMPAEGRFEDAVVHSGDVFSSIETKNYTVYSAVFGGAPFTAGRSVYRFGCPFDFRGFVSTSQKAFLGGVVKGELTYQELRKVDNEVDWYNLVCAANSTTLSYFLNPLTPFNPITNTIVPPHTGAAMKFSDASGEWSQMGISLNEKPDFNVGEFEDFEEDDEDDDYDDDDDTDTDDHHVVPMGGDGGDAEGDGPSAQNPSSSRPKGESRSSISEGVVDGHGVPTVTSADGVMLISSSPDVSRPKREKKRRVRRDVDDSEVAEGSGSDPDAKIVMGAAPDPNEFTS